MGKFGASLTILLVITGMFFGMISTTVHGASGYISHVPIIINSNADFALQGWPGAGTASDPWIIEGLDINGTGKGYGIFIGNTTDSFIIKDNIIYNCERLYSYPGSIYCAGILLNNVTTGLIINNTIHSNYNGICLYSTRDIQIEMNNITDNFNYGVYLDFSYSNLIYHNNIYDNKKYDAWDAPENEDNDNSWDNGYPSGGNYWTPLTSYILDYYSGPNQDILGADGIMEYPSYEISYFSVDNYPFSFPIGYIDSTSPTSEINLSGQNTFPLRISVDTSDPDVGDPLSGISSVKLWYRYSSDNQTYDVWNDISNAVIPPDNSSTFLALPGWYWQFNYPDGEGFYEFSSKAIDVAGNMESGNQYAKSSCVYDITNPISNAGIDQIIYLNTTTTFDGSNSTDNLGITNYTWSLVCNQILITLYGETPEYLFSAVGNYTVTLCVTDVAGNQDSDMMILNVTVDPATLPPPQKNNVTWILVLCLAVIPIAILIIWHSRKRKKSGT
jgi:parallel beta-helix repeat protein